MELKPGYRGTDLGPLPSDWTTKSLGTIGEALIGLTYAPSNIRRYGTLVLRSSNIQNDALAFDDNVFVDMEIPERIMVRPGDVLICVRNGSRPLIGKAALLDERTVGMTFGAFMAVFRSDHGRYINYLFRSHLLKRQIDEQLGATINQITNKSLKSFQVPIPPTDDEIDAIATALSDVDALLESLDRLIAKKRDLKQAAMQQLLTGQTRLPGFSGEWNVKRLRNLGATYGGLSGKRKIDFGRGAAKYVTFLNVLENEKIDFNLCEAVAVRSSERQNRVKMGDILFNGTSETPEDLARGAFVARDVPDVYLNSFCFGFRYNLGEDQDGQFLAYLFRGPVGRSLMSRLAQGATRYNMSKRQFLDLELRLPIGGEQRAISTVLADMDAEIVALERRCEKTRNLKQAMMQELLTGRIRLIEPKRVELHAESATSKRKRHNWAINEAVVIGVLTKHFGSEQYPLGRKRYTKMSYLLHRHAERQAKGYLRKAAGPYNPMTKYGGPEKIALKNGYVRVQTAGKYRGFVAGEKVAQAEAYFEKWYGAEALEWMAQFRKYKNDHLELLTTVDMAAEELRAAGEAIGVEAVKAILARHPDWKAKLERPLFSDKNIARAISHCDRIFQASGGAHA